MLGTRKISSRDSLSWESLIFEDVTRDEIEKYIPNESWQKLRKELKGKSLKEKYNMLKGWLRKHKSSRASKVQVTNYVNALKRGGQV